MQNPKWVSLSLASKSTGIGESTLRRLKQEGSLKPGNRWVYSTGKVNTPVRWNVTAIEQWQIEETQAVYKEKDNKKKDKSRIMQKLLKPMNQEKPNELQYLSYF